MVALGDGTYLAQLNRNGQTLFVHVDGQLPTFSNGQLAYADFGAQGSLWVAIVEKAYAEISSAGNYSSIDGGWMTQAFSALGLSSHEVDSAASGTALLQLIQGQLEAGKAVTFAVGTPMAGTNLISGHAYTVDAVVTDGHGNVTGLTLRNPWGGGLGGLRSQRCGLCDHHPSAGDGGLRRAVSAAA